MPNKRLKVMGDGLRVRQEPSFEGKVLLKLNKGDEVTYVATSENEEWIKIKYDGNEGWCYYKYLTDKTPIANDSVKQQIFDAVATSSIVNYEWKNRGKAKIGFYKGMALVFARVYCKLKLGNQFAKEMAKASTGNASKDVLTFYANKFNEFGMSNEVDGVSTLRHLFVLMMGLAMRESSGRYCVGRDMSANNDAADTAEAGLFQTSYNARTSSALLPQLYNYYVLNPQGFLETFKEGFGACSAADLRNYGTGDGMNFQKLSKESPAFCAEFAAITLRNQRKHYGPVNNMHVEIKPECNMMFLKIQQIVDQNNLTEI